jgi:hypothetical protein
MTIRRLSMASHRWLAKSSVGIDGIGLFCFDYDPEIPSRYRQASAAIKADAPESLEK